MPLGWQCCKPTLSVIYDDECTLPEFLCWKPPGFDFSVGGGSADACPLTELVDGENTLERLLKLLLIHVAPVRKLMVPDIELPDVS